jgi:hypothetical protein
MGEFMRIKVRMDITEPITRFISLEIEDDEGEQDQTNEEMMNNEENGNKDKEGERKIITFKYEYLPDFCYNCGIIRHTEKSRPSRNRREGTRQFGPDLRAVIYKGSSSEERSRSSSEKGNFWLTNSAGNKGKQGSDGASWRKSTPSDCDEGLPKKGDDKEVTSLLEKVKDDQIKETEGKKLSIEDKPSGVEIDGKKTGEGPHPKTSDYQEKALALYDGQGRTKNDGSKNSKSAKQCTFKRIAGSNQHLAQIVNSELKKRNADLMEIDSEAEVSKKARREVNGEANGDDENERNKADVMIAGLQGQPGEPK